MSACPESQGPRVVAKCGKFPIIPTYFPQMPTWIPPPFTTIAPQWDKMHSMAEQVQSKWWTHWGRKSFLRLLTEGMDPVQSGSPSQQLLEAQAAAADTGSEDEHALAEAREGSREMEEMHGS